MVRKIIAGAALAGTLGAALYTAFATVRVRRFRERLSGERPPVNIAASVLKPLHGSETGLYENLKSFCEQDFGTHQIIFGAADPHDPALEIARRLQREHPHLDIEIVAGRAQPARNPKVGNLLGMIGSAKHPLIVIADSDVRVGRDHLRTVASCFAESDVGAATCVYGALHDGTLASALGALFVNDQFAPSVLVAHALEPLTYCFGATMAARADVLAQIGGLAALADHLGDDYLLGNLITRAGYRVELCPYVVHTFVAERNLRSLWMRELRWARTIRTVRPAGFAGSIMTYVIPFSLLFAFVCGSPIAGSAAVALAAVLRMLLHEEARKTFAPGSRGNVWHVPLRDCLSVGVWCSSYLGQNVGWRGSRYRVHGDGRMVGGTDKCNDCV